MMTRWSATLGPTVALVGLCAAGGAWPAPAPARRAPAVQTVVDCRKLEDAAQRLACFDAAVTAMAGAEAAGDLVTVDRAQRRAARHHAFGFGFPSLPFLDHGEKGEEIDRITAKVAGASRNPYGKWIVTLDDGAVWRQIDDNEVMRSPRAGSAAEIRRGVLNSYVMKLDGQLAIKVHRDN